MIPQPANKRGEDVLARGTAVEEEEIQEDEEEGKEDTNASTKGNKGFHARLSGCFSCLLTCGGFLLLNVIVIGLFCFIGGILNGFDNEGYVYDMRLDFNWTNYTEEELLMEQKRQGKVQEEKWKRQEQREMALYLLGTLILLLINFAIVQFLLCKTAPNSSRQWKATVAVFGGCCIRKDRKEYQEAIVPYKDVAHQICYQACGSVSFQFVCKALVTIVIGFLLAGFLVLKAYDIGNYDNNNMGILWLWILLPLGLWGSVYILSRAAAAGGQDNLIPEEEQVAVSPKSEEGKAPAVLGVAATTAVSNNGQEHEYIMTVI